MSDVDAIRNLSDVATKLQTSGKLILPGDLTVQGKIATNDLDPSDMPVGWTGGLRFIDGYASGNMGFGPNKTTINAQINKDGNINFVDGYVSGNMNFGPNNAHIKHTGDIIGKNLNVDGKIITNDLIFTNGFTTGNMAFGPNNTTINVQIKQSGDIIGKNVQIKQSGDITGKNLTLKSAQIKDGNITGKQLIFANGFSSGNMDFGPNNATITAQIKQSGDIKGNDLNLTGNISVTNNNNKWIINNNDTKLLFTRMNGDTNKGAVLDLNENGDVNISGNLTVNNVLTKKNKAKFIRVGNIQTSDILPDSTVTDQSKTTIPIVDNWTLIDIKVFNDKGVNVAYGKDVTLVQGSTESPNSTNKFKNITNGYINDSTSTSNDNIKVGYQGGKGPQQLEINLVDEYDISQIQLFNRTKPIDTTKMNNTIVELITKDNQGKSIINRRINTGLWNNIYSKEFIL